MSKKICSEIGGQAVLEGVMMRGKNAIATAVRDTNGQIQIESNRFKPLKERGVIYKIPIIRGLFNFGLSMVEGMKTLMRTTEVYGEDIETGEPSKFEKWLARVFKIDIMQVSMAVGLLLGLALAIGLFVFLPTYLTKWIFLNIDLTSLPSFLQSFFPNIASGLIKITIFIGYILLVSRMKDINRLFRYHGAEHKTISAYEHGLELTVENVQKMKTSHDRCGSTFIVIVFVVSIVVLSVMPWFSKSIYNFLLRLAFLPIIVGICYELLKIFAKYDNFLTKILKAPGLLLQKLTVKEPDDSMVEVAIAAFNKVLELEADPSMQTTKFDIKTSYIKAKAILLKIIDEKNKANLDEMSRKVDLILLSVLSKDKFSELSGSQLNTEQMEKATEIAKKVAKGFPVQYAIGKAHFYGNDFLIDERALIPRLDTEILFEQVMNEVRARGISCKVLELCTGSGALSISLALNAEVAITATDISKDSLALALSNANLHKVEINFINSNMFENVQDKYDVIFANPPYIPSKDIALLNLETKDHEPIIALDGGEDGLDFYRVIAKEYANYLNPDGVIYLEIGIGQSTSVAQLFEGDVEEFLDYNNPPITRVLRIKPH